MSSGTKTPYVLVIADRERLHGIFELSGVRCARAFTLDEGLKSAQRGTPALLFIQSRLGGLSGEIIARHIRLELKDKKTRLVLLCTPDDMPTPGNKTFSAAVDISLPDDQLANQVRSIADSLLTGKRLKPAAEKRKEAAKAATDPGGKPDEKAPADEKLRISGREKQQPASKARRSADEPSPAELKSVGEISDIVKIGNSEAAHVDPGETAPPPAENAAPGIPFQEELQNAIVKTITGATSGKDAAPIIPATDGCAQSSPPSMVRPGHSTPGKTNKRTSPSRAVYIASFSAVVLGIALLWLFSGTRPTPKMGETGQPSRIGGTAGERKILPAGTHPGKAVGNPDGNGTKTGPLTAKHQELSPKPPAPDEVKYLKYTVRRGDTVFSILTKRFGLSPRMAESLIPQLLDKNGISRNTVLSVGREILIPRDVKIQPLPGAQ